MAELADVGEFIMSGPEVTGIDTDRGMLMDMAEEMDGRPPGVVGATGSYML